MTFSKARYLFLFLSLAGLHDAAAQPLCEVLLKPAFTYSTSGLVVTFEDRSTSFGLESTTAWDYGDGSSGDQQTAHYFTEPGTYTVCLTMTGAILPCEVSFCREVTVPFVSCADTLDAQFSWYTSATNTISFTDASLVVAAEEVLWEFGDGGTSMEQAPTHTWQLPGSQFVCLTRVLDGCTASFCERVQVDGNVTTCGPELFVDFTLEQINDSSIFTPNVVANNVIPLGAIWSYGDGNMDSTLIGSNAYLVPGAYQTCLLVGAVLTSNLDSCFSLVCHTAEQYPPVSVPEQNLGALVAWPNPFGSKLSVELPLDLEPRSVRLFDAVGRSVHEYQGPFAAGVVQLELSGLSEGAYVLVVEYDQGSHMTRLLKASE